MLHIIESFVSEKWLSLIGRNRLSFEDIACGNIACKKNDMFKKYKDNNYICICGYELNGNYSPSVKHKLSLYCGISKCHIDKTKMDLECIKCSFIKERY